MMKVSVIIPAYNRKQYILEVMQTLQNQDYDQSLLQVIVADHESNDGTREALQGLNCNYSLKIITIPREHNFEAAKLRNRAAREADGDILIFVDSDILLPRNFISNHLKYYRSAEDMVSVIGSVYYLENKAYPHQIEQIYATENLTIDPLETDYSGFNECGPTNPLVWMMYHAGNVSITRKAFEASGGFDEWHTEWSIEDLDFGYQLFKRGVRICYSKYAYGLHKWHESGSKNAQSIDHGFMYLIQKEDNNELIECVYKNIKRNKREQERHIYRTKASNLEEYAQYKMIQDRTYRVPILTIAIYSASHHECLYSILDSLDSQYNSKFEVLIIDDSSSVDKDAQIQRKSYSFDCRVLHVNWYPEKKAHLIDRLSLRKAANSDHITNLEHMFLNAAERSMQWREEQLKQRFEELVYDQALGTYVQFMDDQADCGPMFVKNLWRDVIFEE